jgi:outer membrane lipoprotein SlyB
MNSHLKSAGALALVAALAACASAPPQHMSGSQPINGGYSNNGYSQPVANGNYGNSANYGVVTRIDTVEAKRDTGIGAAIGAGVGAIAGNQIGRSMNDAKTTGTVAGAVGGGLIGNAIERNQNKNNTINRIYVRLDNGSERYWELPISALNVQVGSRVRIENDQLYAN